MAEFSVWAPVASGVEVVLDDARVKMEKDVRGWWHASIDSAGPGTRYRYSIDGGDPLPDPRSHYQPDGVHGQSEIVDHSAFGWIDKGFRPPPGEEHVIYEMHVGTFTPEGTFDAALERLDHLVELGITAVELMPVAEFPGTRGWGYDGVGLYAPHRAYGGPDGLKRFVNACHNKNLAVLLDVVYNHLGPEGNHLGRFGPYFSDRYRTPWGDAINLDGAYSTEVRDFLIGNALMWLREYHFDGLRIDAIHTIYDQSAIHFLEELAVRVDDLKTDLGRPLWLVAESDLNNPRVVTPRNYGGYGIDAQWTDDLHHALHAVLTGEQNGYYRDFGRISDLAKALKEAYVFDGRYSKHRRRRHGRPASGIPGSRFVACLQNHDQVGNRALGDRISHLVGPDLHKVGAAIVLTAPFLPLLFMGEEWGATSPFCYFTDHESEDLGRAVSEGRRNEFKAFGWRPEDVPDPQDLETFYMSRLDWGELEKSTHRELFDWYKALIALRRDTPALRDDNLDHVGVRYDDDEGWLILERGSITVVANFSETLVIAPVSDLRRGPVLLASAEEPEIRGDEVILGPESVTIYTNQ